MNQTTRRVCNMLEKDSRANKKYRRKYRALLACMTAEQAINQLAEQIKADINLDAYDYYYALYGDDLDSGDVDFLAVASFFSK